MYIHVCIYLCKSAQLDGNIPLSRGHMLVKEGRELAQTIEKKILIKLSTDYINKHVGLG